MPANEEELPGTLERSPKKVQHAYEETLDSAHEQYDSEQQAHRVAWGSVKNIAEKVGDHWELKDETGPSDSRSKQPQHKKIKGEGETYGGIDVEGNTRDELVERAKKAGVKGYSSMNKHELGKALQRKQG
ncbi:ChaB family protein [Nakamurella leprariae]|uniref:ChaB family protein n=1 Tax=Nakamurella leprariae TaxID=2803911 RepID=A0A939C2Q8_9ACTN|nr:ChaB family protein [Nakamurella leprariae]MBM9468357.1 ChaB family protein [Nakamurella leprariae]